MTISKHDKDAFDKVVKALLLKKVVILPTDTVYGFSGIVPFTKEEIQNIKGRDDSKPFIQLIAKPEDIFLYTTISLPQNLLAKWPGALTVIVPTKEGNKVGFRCPNDEWLRKVIEVCGHPLYSTSVNRTGKPLLTEIEAMEEEFATEVELIVASEQCKNGIPSTIVEITDSSMNIIRQGSVLL